MNDEKTTLWECLFSLVSSFNTALDRLDTLTNRHERLLSKNDEVFNKMREEFLRKIIEHEVNKEIEKNKARKNKARKK